MCIYAPCLGLVPKRCLMRASFSLELELGATIGTGNGTPGPLEEQPAVPLTAEESTPASGQSFFEE